MNLAKLTIKLISSLILLVSFYTIKAIASEATQDITATSINGDQVVLHPNGRWEFIDTKKAVKAAEIAKQYPENQGCVNGEQGGFLGLVRCIPMGDKDFNRGSATGKGR